MKRRRYYPKSTQWSVVATVLCVPLISNAQSSDSGLEELESFIAQETALEDSNSLMPTDRTIGGLSFSNLSLLDIPRSVTALSPEALEQYQINDVYDLARVVPGASVTNFYGVPGIPTTRGLFTSIYFNGMQRVWNRNGYPTSFGSLEAMEYVKGPPPPSYSAASPGGYVNFIPKSPYFDEFRGSASIEYGRWDHVRAQIDVGGPFLMFDNPAAFRVSISQQEADSYYKGIFNDYTSVYGSLKVKLSDSLSMVVGGEFYTYDSKENPGWNRVTQDLIDKGEYIVGEPTTDLTIIQPDGRLAIDRSLLASATPFGGTYGSFGDSFAGRTSDSGFRPNQLSAANAAFYKNLGGISNPGAGVTTVKIDGSLVLTDPDDFVTADTYLAFFDVIFSPSADLKITNKSFFDGYEREKYSTYGYAEYGENSTFENKTIVEQSLEFDSFSIDLSYGGSIRYEDSLAKTDYTVEPMSRRDLTVGPTPNTILPTGNDIAPGSNGANYWDPYGSLESELLTVGVFVNAIFHVGDKFSLLAGIREDYATWETYVPDNIGFNPFAPQSGDLVTDDDKTYMNFMISPSYKITDKVTAYYTYQQGTAFQGFYVSGGVSGGDTNYQESSLHEVGLRASLMDGRLYAATTYFYQDLVNFDQRGGIAVPQYGRGVEAELTWAATDALTVQGSVTWQEHFFRSDTVPGGFVPLTPEQMVDYAGIFYADFGGRPNPGGPRFGIPEWKASLLVKYQMENGFGISGGPSFTDSYYANPDKTLLLHDYVEWIASVFYKTDRFEITLSGENLTSEDIFTPSDGFAANAIITKAPPISWKVTFKYLF